MSDRLLIVTQKVDEQDQLLGFFISWIRMFEKVFSQVSVLCLWKGAVPETLRVPVVSMGKERGIPKFVQLWRFYRTLWALRRRYDAVFVHMNPIWVILGWPVWRLQRKRVYLWYAHKQVTLKLRLAVMLCDGIFSSTPEGFRLRSMKVSIVGQGVDMTLFSPSGRGTNADIRILTVGRIAPVKNYEVLFEAMRILLDRNIRCSATVIGAPVMPADDAYLMHLRELVRTLDLGDFVEFIGQKMNNELPSYYRVHDFFVNTSNTGSLDKTIVEAIACGLTVISSNDAARAFLPDELIVSGADAYELAGVIENARRHGPYPELVDYVRTHHSLERLISRIHEEMVARS